MSFHKNQLQKSVRNPPRPSAFAKATADKPATPPQEGTLRGSRARAYVPLLGGVRDLSLRSGFAKGEAGGGSDAGGKRLLQVTHNYAVLLAFSAILLLKANLPAGAKNLLVNGGFDNTNPPLSGWKYNYEDTGNSNWASNHLYVAITNIAGAQKYALDLTANKWYLWTWGQGIMVDSDPVPVEPNGKYRLTASARSTGCNARILVEGYRWRPGIKPHPKPKLGELRKCYRFPLLNFKGETPGTMSDVGETWKRASLTFPDGKLTPLAKENFDKIQFLVVHIIAINCDSNVSDDVFFHLYVDDVVLERLD